MATAEELLAQAGVADEALTIDLDSRYIIIPDTVSSLGVESDDDVKRLYFSMPKNYGEFDLSAFKYRINYTNALGESDCYPVEDVTVTDDDRVTFSWLVGRTAFAKQGNVEFNVCLKLLDDESVVIKEFNTTTTILKVLKGLETTEAIVQKNPDIIERILVNMGLVPDEDELAVDPTLSVEGAAADAKAVGDALAKISTGSTPTDSLTWDDLPAYERPITVTWDGSLDHENVISGTHQFLLMDSPPEDGSELVGLTFKLYDNGTVTEHTINYCGTIEDMPASGTEEFEAIDAYVATNFGEYFGNSNVTYAIVLNHDTMVNVVNLNQQLIQNWDYTTVDGVDTPTAYISEFATTVLKKLDSKFLPEDYIIELIKNYLAQG